MEINQNTKISKLINAHPDAIDAIISINPLFNKLKNPFLRKTLASRVTIHQAARIAGISVEDFYEKLVPLGFKLTSAEVKMESERNLTETNNVPEKVIDFNADELLRQNIDPFNAITKKMKGLKTGEALNVITSFEPVPLIAIANRNGYKTKVIEKENGLFHTWLIKTMKVSDVNSDDSLNSDVKTKDEELSHATADVQTIDVRHLPMPQPFHAVVKALNNLAEDKTLHVVHNKVPQFLLPHLAEIGYRYRLEELASGDVNIYIFR